jgi:hypothetical protein
MWPDRSKREITGRLWPSTRAKSETDFAFRELVQIRQEVSNEFGSKLPHSH